MSLQDSPTEFDWSIVNKLDQNTIENGSDKSLISRFLKMVLNSDFSMLSPSSFPRPLFPKLLTLLQTEIHFLLVKRNSLKNIINDANIQNQKLKEMFSENEQKLNSANQQIERMKMQEANLTKQLHNLKVQGETCPICGKRFKTLEYIDKHILNRHKEFLEAWKCIRNNTPNLLKVSGNNNNNGSGNQNNGRKIHNLQIVKGDTVTVKIQLPKVYQPTDIEIIEVPVASPTTISRTAPSSQSPRSKSPLFNTSHPFAMNNSNEMTQGQMDSLANYAAGNILKEMNEIAQNRKQVSSANDSPRVKNEQNNQSTTSSDDTQIETVSVKKAEPYDRSVNQSNTPPINIKGRPQNNNMKTKQRSSDDNDDDDKSGQSSMQKSQDPFVIAKIDPFLLDNEENPPQDDYSNDENDINTIPTTSPRAGNQVEMIQMSKQPEEKEEPNKKPHHNGNMPKPSPRSSSQNSAQPSLQSPHKKRKKSRRHPSTPGVQKESTPGVKFCFNNTNRPDQHQHQSPKKPIPVPQEKIESPPKKPEPVIGIVKRTDVNLDPIEDDYDDFPPARVIEDKVQPKRIGGYQITNTELDELIQESSEYDE